MKPGLTIPVMHILHILTGEGNLSLIPKFYIVLPECFLVSLRQTKKKTFLCGLLGCSRAKTPNTVYTPVYECVCVSLFNTGFTSDKRALSTHSQLTDCPTDSRDISDAACLRAWG